VLGWSAGRVQARFLKFLRVWGRAGLNFAGADKKFQSMQDYSTDGAATMTAFILV